MFHCDLLNKRAIGKQHRQPGVGLRTNKPPKRILLVEDNDINRQLLEEYLVFHGYQVLSLPGGSGFFQALADFQPQLVLLDLKLPDIDGYTLLQQIQHEPNWQHVPVIVVSAFAFRADQERAFSLGVRQYFIKPLNLNALIQAIQEQLDNISE